MAHYLQKEIYLSRVKKNSWNLNLVDLIIPFQVTKDNVPPASPVLFTVRLVSFEAFTFSDISHRRTPRQ